MGKEEDGEIGGEAKFVYIFALCLSFCHPLCLSFLPFGLCLLACLFVYMSFRLSLSQSACLPLHLYIYLLLPLCLFLTLQKLASDNHYSRW